MRHGRKENQIDNVGRAFLLGLPLKQIAALLISEYRSPLVSRVSRSPAHDAGDITEAAGEKIFLVVRLIVTFDFYNVVFVACCCRGLWSARSR